MTNSPKKNYGIRPPAIERMVFAQFVAEYRLLDLTGKETQDAENKLGRTGTVGPPSNTLIAGTAEMAPTIVKLENSRIMKKFQQKESNLLPMVKCEDQTLDDRAKIYLFKPWRRPELLMLQEDLNVADIKACDLVRLELYPTSYVE